MIEIKMGDKVARIDGSHYLIGKEEKASRSEFRGFGERGS